MVLVPALDEDGNEKAGVRMPELAVPFATTTGWSVRSIEGGNAGELCYLDGMVMPFAPTAFSRETTKDPRPSLAERYKDKEEYLSKVREAAKQLQARGFMLEEDIERVVARADRMVRFEQQN
jgi:hypothetical protein